MKRGFYDQIYKEGRFDLSGFTILPEHMLTYARMRSSPPPRPPPPPLAPHAHPPPSDTSKYRQNTDARQAKTVQRAEKDENPSKMCGTLAWSVGGGRGGGGGGGAEEPHRDRSSPASRYSVPQSSPRHFYEVARFPSKARGGGES